MRSRSLVHLLIAGGLGAATFLLYFHRLDYVPPYLAHDSQATIEEARRLWKAVNRDNVMIKVPASLEGLPAIRQLTSEGVNVNITLLFGIERY